MFDMQWYFEAKTAVDNFRQGQAARKDADEKQAQMKAG